MLTQLHAAPFAQPHAWPSKHSTRLASIKTPTGPSRAASCRASQPRKPCIAWPAPNPSPPAPFISREITSGRTALLSALQSLYHFSNPAASTGVLAAAVAMVYTQVEATKPPSIHPIHLLFQLSDASLNDQRPCQPSGGGDRFGTRRLNINHQHRSQFQPVPASSQAAGGRDTGPRGM